jgi:predicted CXXCH cytochrome family protein
MNHKKSQVPVTERRAPCMVFAGGIRKVDAERFDTKLHFVKQNLLREVLLPLAMTVCLCAPRLFAGQHPVPLEKNGDVAKCLECHADKSKGKNVHSAIAMGCTACHEVRVNKDVTRVKLTTATVSSLCFGCHADKNPSSIKGTVHPPAVRDCAKCHDPHVSDNKYQLLKATSGDAKENLCLSCHRTGLNVPKEGSRHAALDMGCETCHVTHKTGERGKQEFDDHLTKATPALCLDCHDANAADLQKAHQGQPFATANCVQCHNPHQSNQAHLMQKFVHAPFQSGSCDTCHAAPKDGKVVLTQGEAKAICVTCHSDQAEQIEKAKVQHPGAQGDCTTCHNPHAGPTPGFVQPNPVEACLGCHSEQADQFKKAHLHQPAFDQSCAICHDPHGGDNEHLLRTKTADSLCLECHGPDSVPKKVEEEHLYTIFDGKVKLPDDYFAKNRVVVIPVKSGIGHPIAGHPVKDVMDPTDVTKVYEKINCLTCHQPHASAQPGLLVNDQANNTAFCATCHKNLNRQ